MSRFFKIIGYLVLSVAVLGAIGFGLAFLRSNQALQKTYAVSPRPVAIPTASEALVRGKHIAETRGCVDCHGKDFGGDKVIDDAAMGRLFGPNITRGAGGRMASFKDEDWVRAIRHGVGPDQRGLFIMPSEEYSHFSDEDLGALIAYMKTVPAVNRERVPTSLGPVSRILIAAGKIKLSAETIDHANLRPLSVPIGTTVEYGRYLAASCMGCHGPNFSGGKIEVGPPSWPQASNLTPHANGRISKWSEADFLTVMQTARRPDGTELNPVMPRAFGQMNEIELKALWAFFKSLPAAEQGAR